jgi:abequosyltransferase
VIVDGGDYDKTMEMVVKSFGYNKNIKVVPSISMCGVALDINQAVSEASGEYCWLFSDDDVLEEGAFNLVEQKIAENPSAAGITVNYQAFDSKILRPIATVPAYSGKKTGGEIDFESKRELFCGLNMHLGFISCQIVLRSKWVRAVNERIGKNLGGNWVIPNVIGVIMEDHPKWKYLNQKCVRYRSGNDSFIDRYGIVQRQKIANLDFYEIIALAFPNDITTMNTIKNRLLADRIPRNLAVLKAGKIDLKAQVEIFKIYLKCYSGNLRFWLTVAPLFIVPNWIFHCLKRAYFYRNEFISTIHSPAGKL